MKAVAATFPRRSTPMFFGTEANLTTPQTLWQRE